MTAPRLDPHAAAHLRLLLATIVACLAVAKPLRSENVIQMGYGEGAPGDSGIDVVVTATNDTAIHGYSVAFTYPVEALSLASITTSGTHVQSLSPDFVAPSFDDQLGVGRMGVIFSFKEPVTLKELAPSEAGSYPRIIARLSFSVKATAMGGSYPLRLVNGIGQPASFNRFTSRGASISPKLVDGSFFIAGGNVLTIDKAMAFPGVPSTTRVMAFVEHPDPLDGFQIGFTFNKSALELTETTYAGTILGLDLGQSGLIEYFGWNVDPNFAPSLERASAASLFDYLQPFKGQKLSACVPPACASPGQSLVRFTFQVNQDAYLISQYLDLMLEDTGIPGLLDNRFIVRDRSLDPQLVPGRIYFSTGFLAGKVIDSVTLQGVAGVNVATDPDGQKAGFSATTNAQGEFRIVGPTPPAAGTGIPAGGYSLVFSKSGYYSSRHSTTSDGSAIVVAGEGATSDAGTFPLYKVPASDGVFTRGRINADAKADLSDAVSLLQYLFQGKEAPGCLMAADVNDTNKVDISDSIYLLNYFFLGGSEPPPPFSPPGQPCTLGTDPTPGGILTCVTTPRCQ